MCRQLCLCLLLCLVARPALAATIIVDENSVDFTGAGFTDPGVSSAGWAFNREKINNTFGATGTWSATLPSAGDYWVQVRWVTHSAHTNNADYAVNATVVDSVDQRQTSAQGSTLSLPFADNLASGWYTLGKYALTAGVNTVSLIQDGSGFASADAVRFSDTDFLVSEASAAVQAINGWTAGNSFGTAGNATNTPYFYNNNASAQATYTLLAATPGATAGNYVIDISWGVASSHSSNAIYLLDLDGNLLTLGDQTTFNIDQREDAFGSVIADGSWSDFYTLGTHALTTSSLIQVTNGAGGSFLTLDDFRLSPIPSTPVVPEPASMVLVMIGGSLMLGRARRNLTGLAA